MPRVSVIIPAYDHAAFIAAAIDSVLAQTYQDFEIIVVNDDSPDETEEALRPYIESGKIRYLWQENQGAAAARNRGAAMAEGEYLSFLDDDDRWPSDKLEWQMAGMESSNAVMLGGVTDAERLPAPLEIMARAGYQTLKVVNFFERNPFGSPGQTIIRRSAFEAVGGFDADIWGVDDYDLWIRLSCIGEIRKYWKLALFYRFHDANASLDYARMTSNLKRVICKNNSVAGCEKMRQFDRLGHRYLFNYAGKKMIWKAGACMLSGDFQKGTAILNEAFRYYKGRLLKDPKLFSMLILALIKIPMRARRYL
jgi:glycosyltransferase involved in cell wall biosynthesis